jgi:RimJ/RimL family protein N-acetyltransferase
MESKPQGMQTRNLVLREIVRDDIPLIHELNSIPEVDKYNTLGLPENITETEKLILPIILDQHVIPRPRYVYLIQDRAHNFVGLIGIVMEKQQYSSAELWYKLHTTYWNRGYASESVKCILDFCFGELKLHRVIAGCATENMASIKVLEKNGFVKEAHHRKILPIRGEWKDNYEYSILEEDYFNNKKA